MPPIEGEGRKEYRRGFPHLVTDMTWERWKRQEGGREAWGAVKGGWVGVGAGYRNNTMGNKTPKLAGKLTNCIF